MEFLLWTKYQVYPFAIWIEIQFIQSQEKKKKKTNKLTQI